MTANIAILQELVKGSPNGSIDADLLRLNSAQFQANATNKQLELLPALLPNDANIPGISDASTTQAPTQRAVRHAIEDLDAVGRLLPAEAGDTGTVLLGDKTFGAVPASSPHVTALVHDNFDFNCAHTTSSNPNHQSRVIGSGYNVNNYDLIRIYIGDPSNLQNLVPTHVRQLRYEFWLPADIPPTQIIPSNSGFELGRNRYMVGNMVQTWSFFELGSRENEPILRLWSVSKETDGRLRVNYLRQSRSGFDQNWFGFSDESIEMRVGISGITF